MCDGQSIYIWAGNKIWNEYKENLFDLVYELNYYQYTNYLDESLSNNNNNNQNNDGEIQGLEEELNANNNDNGNETIKYNNKPNDQDRNKNEELNSNEDFDSEDELFVFESKSELIDRAYDLVIMLRKKLDVELPVRIANSEMSQIYQQLLNGTYQKQQREDHKNSSEFKKMNKVAVGGEFHRKFLKKFVEDKTIQSTLSYSEFISFCSK
jgi:hypothetical protein